VSKDHWRFGPWTDPSQRILNYAGVVGRERVVASSDWCFGAFSGSATVHPDLVWPKLEALAEGAELASRGLF
jgi:5-methyltetrahydropteroyltriglutamate--homocysteine methyltransferase